MIDIKTAKPLSWKHSTWTLVLEYCNDNDKSINKGSEELIIIGLGIVKKEKERTKVKTKI